MIYREIKGDLFTAPRDNILVHCISADHAMGAGIAKKFTEMGIKDAIAGYCRPWKGVGYAFFACSKFCPWYVMNLVTKEKYWMKPTYTTLRQSLEEMKNILSVMNKTFKGKISMPRIGCGLDRLEWNKVREIVQEVFKDTDVKIVVYIKE